MLQLEAFLGGTPSRWTAHPDDDRELYAKTLQAVERISAVGGQGRRSGCSLPACPLRPRQSRVPLPADRAGAAMFPTSRYRTSSRKPRPRPWKNWSNSLNALAGGTSPMDATTHSDLAQERRASRSGNGFIPRVLKKEFCSSAVPDQQDDGHLLAGDPVPWELLYPFDGPNQDAGFLVDQFPVALCRSALHPPNLLRIASADVVLSGPLAHVGPSRGTGNCAVTHRGEFGHAHGWASSPRSNGSSMPRTLGCSTSPATTHLTRPRRTPRGS